MTERRRFVGHRTTAEANNFVGRPREITIDVQAQVLHIHDGQTPGGFPVARQDLANVAESTVALLLASYQLLSQKVTSVTAASTNDDYPSARAVWQLAEGLASAINQGDLGEFKLTNRKTLPDGCVWLDGAEYSGTSYPEFYELLLDDEFYYLSYEQYANQINEYGYCGCYALDAVGGKFKVPQLTNCWIKLGNGEPVPLKESLPNLKGNGYFDFLNTVNGASSDSILYSTNDAPSHLRHTNGYNHSGNAMMRIDLSRGSSIYQDNAHVQPNSITLPIYTRLKPISL